MSFCVVSGRSLQCQRFVILFCLSPQTCLELERYLQTEPKRLSELFEDELDRLLSPDFMEGHGEDKSLNPSLFSLASSPLHLDGETLTTPSTPDPSELGMGVDVAQLNALTSLTPPSSPELERHSLKAAHTLCATADGTLMLKLAVARPLSPGPSDGEQAGGVTGGRDSADSKKRVHRCQFDGCRKVYTKSSHLKAHQRTHTGRNSCSCTQHAQKMTRELAPKLLRHHNVSLRLPWLSVTGFQEPAITFITANFSRKSQRDPPVCSDIKEVSSYLS